MECNIHVNAVFNSEQDFALGCNNRKSQALRRPFFRLRLCPRSPFMAIACANPERSGDGQECSNWERVELLERLLDLSVSEENYSEAVKLKDTLEKLKSKLTTAELMANTDVLRGGDTAEKLQAIERLGTVGDNLVIPMLSLGLRDENEKVVAETEKAMWKIFMRSGKKDVDERIQEGVSQMVKKDGLIRARYIFSEVIQMAPSFAEAYNKRATVYFFLQDYQKSIQDCYETLKLNPYHFGALSGLGLCYVAIEDPRSGLYWLEKAYALHPGLAQIGKCIQVLKKVREAMDAIFYLLSLQKIKELEEGV